MDCCFHNNLTAGYLTVEAESLSVLTGPSQTHLVHSLPAVLDDPLPLGTDLVVAGSAQLVALKF